MGCQTPLAHAALLGLPPNESLRPRKLTSEHRDVANNMNAVEQEWPVQMANYSDDDVSDSGDQLGHEEHISNHDADSGSSDDQDGDLDNARPSAVAAAAGTAAKGLPAAIDEGAAASAEDALSSGELSTNAALLQLQVNDLLSESAICRRPGLSAAVDQLVQHLSAVLSSLPATTLTGQYSTVTTQLISSWGVKPEDISLPVTPPTTVQLVGSWALAAAAALPRPPGSTAAAAAAAAVVDVAVQMPSSCFHHKDLLNYRYHGKRALYLSAISDHLASQTLDNSDQTRSFRSDQQQLAALHGDPCKPCLLLHINPNSLAALLPAAAAGFGGGGVVLRLLPVIGLDVFEISKLAPDRNNVRWVCGSSSSSGSRVVTQQQQAELQQQQQPDLLPTPHYNAGILSDMVLLLMQHRLQQYAATAGPRFVDALILLKMWAHRSGLSMHGSIPSSSSSTETLAAAAAQADGFSGYLLASLLAAAVQQVGVAAATAMSPLQLFRCVLQLLINKQFWGAKGAGGIALPRDSSVPVELRLLQQQQPLPAAAAPVAGKISKDQIRLQQKLQQQSQQIPAAAAAAPGVFKKAYDIVTLDSTGHLNLAANTSRSCFQLAQMTAQQTLHVLDRQGLDADVGFNVVFGPSQGLAGVFDYWWTVDVPAAGAGSSVAQQQQQPGDQHPARLMEQQVENLVRQALTTRAVLVKAIRRSPELQNPTPHQQQQQQQQQSEAKPDQPRKKHKKSDGKASAAANSSSSSGSLIGLSADLSCRICVGVITAAAAALRVVDVGPAADDVAAAAAFRQIWGDRAELRRFQDGKICEAVVWEGVPPGERHRIPDMAVQHVLLRHLPSGTVVQSCSTALDHLLYPSYCTAKGSADVRIESGEWVGVKPSGAGSKPSAAAAARSAAVQIGSRCTSAAAAAETAASRSADTALDSLAKQLRGLSDVALKVIGVQPLSAVNRHTCCFYPEPHPLVDSSGVGGDGVLGQGGVKVPRVVEPIKVMVQLEGSGKMPSDPIAFTKTKAALGVQLAGAMTAACGAAVTATEEALEVLWQGFAFKLLLFIDRDNPTPTPTATPNSPAAAHMPLPLLLSHHHGLISNLEASHAAYGPTVRLAKRWLGLQLMLGAEQVTPEAVELIVGAVFQGPQVTQPPASRISGFLSFLHLLINHPWSAGPLLVDPAGEVTPDNRRRLLAEYEGRRIAGTAPGMFIATPYDMHSSIWTTHHPSAAVMQHIVSLARTALQQLTQLLLLGSNAPVAQQQLHILQRRKHRKDPAARKEGATGADLGSDREQQQQHRLHQEMTALAQAWRTAAGPNLSGFDVWIVLRKESLPFAERADPLAAQQLEALLKQQQKRRLQLMGMAGGDSSSGSKSRKGQIGVERYIQNEKRRGGDSNDDDDVQGNDSRAAGDDDALGSLLSTYQQQSGIEVQAPKTSRAVLRSIPEQVLVSKPANKLRAELLVGFDPVSHYVGICTERYGHLATFCADAVGAFPAIGVKWKPEAFVPAPLRPALAYGMMEIGVTSRVATAARAKGGKKSRNSGLAGLVVPNVAQVLSELGQLGVGVVQEVVLMQ